MYVKKTTHEVVEEALQYLYRNTPITNYSNGSIARSLIEAVAPDLGVNELNDRQGLYDVIQSIVDNTRFSTAKDEHLDAIVALVGAKRRLRNTKDGSGESITYYATDEELRSDIEHHLQRIRSSNYDAIYSAIIMVDGVAEIIPLEYELGTGSFKIIVIEERGQDPEYILQDVHQEIVRLKAFGIKAAISFPERRYIDMTIEVLFKQDVKNVEAIKEGIRSSARNYIEMIPVGEPFIYHQFINYLMTYDKSVYDVAIQSFTIDEYPVMLTNQHIEKDQRFAVKEIQIL